MGRRIDAEISTVSIPAVIGICIGSIVFVLAAVLTVCIYAGRKRSSRRMDKGGLRQFLLPKDVRPVMSFKTAAGPGGLKKSPSPIQSPENPESQDWSRGGTMKTSGSKSGGPDEALLAKVDCEMDDTSEMKCREEHAGEKERLVGGTKEAPMGSLQFSLRYNFDKNALLVTIGGATGLPPRVRREGGKPLPGQLLSADDAGVSLLDPYVKLQLLPEKQHKVKTRVVRNTLNPAYEEEFTFYGLNYNQLQSTTLHFAVISFDRYSRDEIIGEVVCPLHSVDLSDSDRDIPMSMELINRTTKFENSQSRGELLVSLCYQPAANRITAVVLKARGLPKFDITGLADPYVKVYLMYKGQKLAKKKTHVKKRTLDPVFNESFQFELPCGEGISLDHLSLSLMVMDWDRVTKNEVMGRVEIGPQAKNNVGRSHWEEVKKAPRHQIAEWHKLKP